MTSAADDAWSLPARSPPRAYGGPLARATFKFTPEDFCVEERLGFVADGGQGQVLLQVEKVGMDTQALAARLAALGRCPVRDVGFAGLKDRHARTRQWFTLPARGRAVADWASVRDEAADGSGFRVLEAAPHARKLKRGALRGNRFLIRLRDVVVDGAVLDERCRQIAAGGVPNYFGPQRFGRDGANLARVQAWLAGQPVPGDARARGFLFSAARSLLFNAVLAARVRDGSWNRLLPGELVNLDGSRSFFAAPDIDAVLDGRLAALDIHPTGPLDGAGDGPALAAGALEALALGAYRDVRDRLAGAGLAAARRALRVVPREFSVRRDGADLEIGFVLVAGAYATTVLAELFELDGALPGDSPGDEA